MEQKKEDEKKYNANAIESLRLLFSEDTFYKVCRNSLKNIIPSYRRTIFLVFGFVVFWRLFYLNTNNIVVYSKTLISIILPCLVTLITMVLTGHAIFQAFSSKETLVALLQPNGKGDSIFIEMNRHVFITLISYVFAICLSLISYIIIVAIPETWECPYMTAKVNDNIAAGSLAAYLVFVLHIVIELKSFVYNLYQCFKVSVKCKIMDEETQKI